MCEYATITRVVAPAITRDIIRRSKLINPDVERYLRLVHEAWEAGDTPAQLERKLLALRASRAARQVSLSAIRALGL